MDGVAGLMALLLLAAAVVIVVLARGRSELRTRHTHLLAQIGVLTSRLADVQPQIGAFQQLQADHADLQTHFNNRVQALHDEDSAQMAAFQREQNERHAEYVQLQNDYTALQEQVNERAQEQVEAWRSRELDELKAQMTEAAHAEAKVALERWQAEEESKIRDDAIRRSTGVVRGKVTEHLAPYMADFPYNPKDARFLGTPIDLIIFDGLYEDDIRGIVFLEIKSGSSSLSPRERLLRDAVIARRVTWQEFRVPTVDGNGNGAPSPRSPSDPSSDATVGFSAHRYISEGQPRDDWPRQR
jgi:predicted Holliday junction resolvase-like endonuclease